ncbi:MAG: hypothetical protein FVQ77_06240 [Cytophagales bacterium]|nr:hypothetical protein [Cytophagales bacterium]
MKTTKYILSFISIVVLYLPIANAQSKFIPDKYHYDKEYTYGLNVNTNGGILGGFTFKYAKFIKPARYHSLSVEIVSVKHPKELKDLAQATGNTYIPKKQNYFFVIRPQYGREFILFKKNKRDDIQIDFICSFGPAIGILKPYYVLYDLNECDTLFCENNVQSVAYVPDSNYLKQYIHGSGGFFNGFDQSKFKLGANLKISFSVEFSSYKNKVSGIEAGFLLEAYPFDEAIIIMGLPNENETLDINKNFFSSAFITIYYGKRFQAPLPD